MQFNNISRRGFLARSVAGATAFTAAPAFLERRRPRLRVLGTHVTLQEAIRLRAEKDLGIEISFEPGGSAEVLQRASTRPDSFDIFEQWSNTIPVLWQAGAIRSIETSRIELWDEINALAKTGRLSAEDSIAAGDAPHELLYVQKDATLSSRPSDRTSFLPYVHNVDSYGYALEAIKPGKPYETESWAALLDERWHGKVALVNEPTIGLFDAALAARANGEVEISNIGDMTRREIDDLFDLLVRKKKAGHFYGVWRSVPESVKLMLDDKVVVQSMFSPAVATLNATDSRVAYAAPKEGYRAWQGVMCLSSQATDEAVDAGYRFMNWWLSGWAGALIARQGYYISVPGRARRHMTNGEWEYYYAGKAATRDLPNTSGQTAVRRGDVRRGGSYEERLSHIAVWNTVMKKYEYSMTRWDEFVTS